jgi:type VI secretion system secreted protein VgrG
MVIPRIGMEVVVEFLEGDPDKPLVTGCVYNGRQTVPYPLPEHKTKSVLRSNTHKGQGFNELTFEDEQGIENMFFHAQKDQTTRVLNDRTKRVDRHEAAFIGENRVVEVGNNQKHEIGGSLNMVVGGTGTSALALMAAVSGLAGHTAGLLKQAGEVAGGGGPALGGFAATLASSALGFLGGGGLSARNDAVSGESNRPDAGRTLGDKGSAVGDAASGLFPMPGVMNTIVGAFKSDTIGIARVEQIGMSKVTNVGATSLESVGKYKKVSVGETFEAQVGKSASVEVGETYQAVVGKTAVIDVGEVLELHAGERIILKVGEVRLQLDKSGLAVLEAPLSIVLKGGAGQVTVGPGPVLYAPALVPGKVPTPPAICLRQMAASSTPFVGI